MSNEEKPLPEPSTRESWMLSQKDVNHLLKTPRECPEFLKPKGKPVSNCETIEDALDHAIENIKNMPVDELKKMVDDAEGRNDYEKDFEELNKDPEYLKELLKLEQEENDYLKSKVKSCEKILSEIYKTLIKGDGPMSWQIISAWKKEQKNEL